MGNKHIRLLLVSSGCLLMITGAAKLLSAAGSAGILKTPDPIFTFPFRNVFAIVGGIELLVALFCLFGTQARLQATVVACLSTDFALYRLALYLIGWRRPCSCLGNMTDSLHIRPEAADAVMALVVGYLVIGSYGAIYWFWRSSASSEKHLSRYSATCL